VSSWLCSLLRLDNGSTKLNDCGTLDIYKERETHQYHDIGVDRSKKVDRNFEAVDPPSCEGLVRLDEGW
jgi:hypothetical protein